MVYCYASGGRPSRPEVRSMQLIDEIFLFLVRLDLGLFEQDLAHHFQIHMSSVSRKVTAWVNYLYYILGGQCIWPSKNEIQNNMPEEFRRLYLTTRVILGCTEILYKHVHHCYSSHSSIPDIRATQH